MERFRENCAYLLRTNLLTMVSIGVGVGVIEIVASGGAIREDLCERSRGGDLREPAECLAREGDVVVGRDGGDEEESGRQ